MFYTFSTILVTSDFQPSLTTIHKKKYILHLTPMYIIMLLYHKTILVITINDTILHTKKYNVYFTLLFYAISLKILAEPY